MVEAMDWAYVIVTCSMSVLSLFGCSVVILTYICFKELRTKGRQILLCVSVSDMLTAIGNIMGAAWVFNDSLELQFCKFQVALHVFSANSMYFWNVAMAIYLYMTLVKVAIEKADKLLPFFHIFCWSLPMLILTISLSMDVFGPDHNNLSPAWCWISSDVDNTFFWQLFTGKFWEITTYIFVSVMYGVIVCHLRRKGNLQKKKVAYVTTRSSAVIDDANIRLTFVPLVFISFRIWGTIRFIINTIVPDPDSPVRKATAWLAILQGFGDSAQGFTNCVLFCLMTAKVRQLLCGVCHTKVAPEEPVTLGERPTRMRDQTVET